MSHTDRFAAPGDDSGRLPAAFLRPGSASFSEFLDAQAPQLQPSARISASPAPLEVPHGTTIVAVTFAGGVLLAGDRRATMGNLIANHSMTKVFAADEYSAVGIAGTAGVALELVRLFQVELEHYEKIEGTLLSLDGKANRLATMIRNNLAMAMQGLSVVPVFTGFDLRRNHGRIFSYDVTGGCYEEADFHGVGSGSLFARGALKKLWHQGLSQDEAIQVTVEALYDAADDDAATGGPDPGRRIFPTVAVVDADGVRFVATGELEVVVEGVVSRRRAGGTRT